MTEAKDTETVFRKTRWNKVCWDNVLIGVERAGSHLESLRLAFVNFHALYS